MKFLLEDVPAKDFPLLHMIFFHLFIAMQHDFYLLHPSVFYRKVICYLMHSVVIVLWEFGEGFSYGNPFFSCLSKITPIFYSHLVFFQLTFKKKTHMKMAGFD